MSRADFTSSICIPVLYSIQLDNILKRFNSPSKSILIVLLCVSVLCNCFQNLWTIGNGATETIHMNGRQQDKIMEELPTTNDTADAIALGGSAELQSNITAPANDTMLSNTTAPDDTMLSNITAPANDTIEDSNTVETRKGSDSKLSYDTTQDDKCHRMFEWSMIDRWQVDDESGIDFENLPQTRKLRTERMGGPAATGTLTMSVKVLRKELKLTVVDARVFEGMSSPMQPNVWHRMVSEYNSWAGLQIAERRYGLISDRTVYLFSCTNGKTVSDLPHEWAKIGEVSCDRGILQDADVIVEPPSNGLLWDLSWDLDFECHNSEMFKTFASLFVDKSSSLDPVGCFISRQGRNVRSVINIDEMLEMMREVFSRVRVIALTEANTADEIIDVLYECRVLFGVHGAGHMNAMFARPGVAVVEMIGRENPGYFRNINMLLGQHYESIKGDPNKGMPDNFHVDLFEAKAALERAKDHAALWIEENGKWR